MEDDDRDDRRDEPRDSGDNGNNGGSAEEGTKIYIGNLNYQVRYHRLYYIFTNTYL